ncbi:MAG: hypothetical protein KDB35_05670, partial [Acidimicrobiales bacterium]|nr:hypothetical protein [Acidimicrobiales bacterium]
MTDSPFSVRGSVLQVSVTGPAGTAVELLDAAGAVVRTGEIDRFGDRLALADLGVTDGLKGLGGLVFRHLEPGAYTLRLDGEEAPVTVLDPFVLPDDFDARVRGQRLDEGYGYVEVRDGALLSVGVSFPDRARWGDGPYPTLVQYSGYKDAKDDFATGDPANENILNTEANLALHCGYAVVGAAIRGSGGSEGSFLLLEPIQGTDGHDVVEAVAAQPWVARKRDGAPKVGMIGRSMPGYEQLLVASYNPPSLAAVTPAAVGGRPYGAAGRPGGVVNVALARGIAGWQVDPVDPPGGIPQVQPPRFAPGGWDDWVAERIAGGDEVCERNQLLRGQAVDAVPAWAFVDQEEGGVLAHADGEEWAARTHVPTLVLGAWQDQESGPWFTDLLDRYPDDTVVRLAAYNGTHEETRFPLAAAQWLEFLAFFVREELPAFPDAAARYLDEVTAYMFPEGLEVRFDHWAGTTFDEALEAYRSSPPLVVWFDNGWAPGRPPGYPYAAFSVAFDRWPPPEAGARRWYLAPDHRLDAAAPGEGARPLGFHYDPSVRPRTSKGDAPDVNHPCVEYDWQPPAGGRGLQFATPPFDRDTLLVGTASVDLWLRSTAADLDLEVVLSEVRPDGWETFVQAGALRASSRALDDERSTELLPWLSYRRDDVAPLPVGEFTLVRVPVPAAAHLVRAGSSLGITVTAAGGNQPHWELDAQWPEGVDAHGRKVVVDVAVEAGMASSVVLPLVHSWVPRDGHPRPDLPPRDALRRQPSRRWRPAGLEVPAPPP